MLVQTAIVALRSGRTVSRIGFIEYMFVAISVHMFPMGSLSGLRAGLSILLTLFCCRMAGVAQFRLARR